MKEKLLIVLALLMFALLLPACGTLDVGIEGTPVPDGQADPTAAALATENARLSAEVTRLADTADATPFPLAPVPPSSNRCRATSDSLSLP